MGGAAVIGGPRMDERCDGNPNPLSLSVLGVTNGAVAAGLELRFREWLKRKDNPESNRAF